MSEAWALIRWSGPSLNAVWVVGVYETYEDAHAERLAAPLNAPLHVVQTKYHAAGEQERMKAAG